MVLVLDISFIFFVEYNEEWIYLLIIWTIGLMIVFHTLTDTFHSIWGFIKKVSSLFIFMINYLIMIMFIYLILPKISELLTEENPVGCSGNVNQIRSCNVRFAYVFPAFDATMSFINEIILCFVNKGHFFIY